MDDENVNILGIDFGTSNSCFCYYYKGETIALRSNSKNSFIPSCFSYNKKNWKNNNKNDLEKQTYFFSHVKTVLGRHYHNMQEYYATRSDYEVYRPPNSEYCIIHFPEDENRSELFMSAQFATALYLWKTLRIDYHIDGRIKAVLTIPVRYTASQIHAYREAVELAGIEIIAMIHEPVAAALSYSTMNSSCSCVMIYDLGGGTFDVSVIGRTAMNDEYLILNTDGDIRIGGARFDYLLLDEIANMLDEKNDQECFDEFDRQIMGTNLPSLMRKVECVKIGLSESNYVKCEFSSTIELQVGRSDLEKRIEDKLKRTMEISSKCLDQTGRKSDEKKAVLPIGGSSRIPLVKKLLKEQFPGFINSNLGNESAFVAKGACLYAMKKIYAENRKSFSGLEMGVSLYLPYPLYYQFGDKRDRLFKTEDKFFSRKILFTDIDVPSDQTLMQLFQEVGKTPTGKSEYLHFGDLDLSNYAGTTVKLQMRIDHCCEMHFYIGETRKNECPINYKCAMQEDEKRKFNDITSTLTTIEDTIYRIEDEMDLSEEEIEEAKEFVINEREKVMEFIGKSWRDENGNVHFWNDGWSDEMNSIYQKIWNM